MVYEVFSYPGRCRRIGWRGFKTPRNQIPGAMDFVVDREGRSVIGTAGFKGPPDTLGVVEIAYGIVPSQEGRGFATEAAGALVAFAFASEHVQLVRAHTLPMSNASTRVLEKCGFGHMGSVIDSEDGPVWRWERRREPISS